MMGFAAEHAAAAIQFDPEGFSNILSPACCRRWDLSQGSLHLCCLSVCWRDRIPHAKRAAHTVLAISRSGDLGLSLPSIESKVT